MLAAPHKRRVGQLRRVLQHGRNYSKTRLESGTHFRCFHRGALPSSERVQTPSQSRRQVPAQGHCAEDWVVLVQSERRWQAQDLPAWELQGAGPPPSLGTQGFAARSGTVHRIEVAPALSHSVGFKSDAAMPKTQSLHPWQHTQPWPPSQDRCSCRPKRASTGGCPSAGMRITPLGPRGPAPCLWCQPPALLPGGQRQGEQGPLVPAPLHAHRKGGQEPHGKASWAGCDKNHALVCP